MGPYHRIEVRQAVLIHDSPIGGRLGAQHAAQNVDRHRCIEHGADRVWLPEHGAGASMVPSMVPVFDI